MRTASVNVRVADLPALKAFFVSAAALLRALGECDGLPAPVMEAADQLRREVAAPGGKDAGPPPQDITMTGGMAIPPRGAGSAD
jgi:hypothetical protein